MKKSALIADFFIPAPNKANGTKLKSGSGINKNMTAHVLKNFEIAKVDVKSKTAFGFMFKTHELQDDGTYAIYKDLQGDNFTEEASLNLAKDYFGTSVKALVSHAGEAIGKVAGFYPITEDIAKAVMGVKPKYLGVLGKMIFDSESIAKQVEDGTYPDWSVGGKADEYVTVSKEEIAELEKSGADLSKGGGRTISKITLNEVSVCRKGAQDVGTRIMKSQDVDGMVDFIETISKSVLEQITNPEGANPMTKELEEFQTLIKELPADQLAHVAELEGDARTEFFAKSEDDRKAEVEKAKKDKEAKMKKAEEEKVKKAEEEAKGDYVRPDGTIIKASEGETAIALAKQVDELTVQKFNDDCQKQVDELLKNHPGTNEVKLALVKAIMKETDESVRDEMLKAIKDKDSDLSKTSGRQSTSDKNPTQDTAMTKSDANKEWHKRADEMVKEKAIRKSTALDRVLKEDPELALIIKRL